MVYCVACNRLLLSFIINTIFNAHEVTSKCESEAQIVSRQKKMELDIHVLESQTDIMSFQPLLEGRK
jgi:hypothetical protein